MPTPPTVADYIRVLPEIVLSVWGMIVMFVEPLPSRYCPRDAAARVWAFLPPSVRSLPSPQPSTRRSLSSPALDSAT
jgi:hypothetical protein